MTRVKVPIEARCLRIPTQWEILQVSQREGYTRSQFNDPKPRRKTETVSIAVPSFSPDVKEPNLVEVDGWELRNHFLQISQTEESALKFLHDAGVWDINVAEPVFDVHDAGVLSGAFGARIIQGWAVPVPLSEIWEVQRIYRELLGDPGQLRQKFGPRPPVNAPISDREKFAWITSDENTLPVHIEWRRGRATAIAEAISWHEMMTTTTQIDLLLGARFRYCRRPDCNIPFPVVTKHRKIYCSWYCAHIEAVRRTRKH